MHATTHPAAARSGLASQPHRLCRPLHKISKTTPCTVARPAAGLRDPKIDDPKTRFDSSGKSLALFHHSETNKTANDPASWPEARGLAGLRLPLARPCRALAGCLAPRISCAHDSGASKHQGFWGNAACLQHGSATGRLRRAFMRDLRVGQSAMTADAATAVMTGRCGDTLPGLRRHCGETPS